MIGLADIQAAAVQKLKAAPAVVALVGDQVAEVTYQSDVFKYPNLRVAVALEPSDCDGEHVATLTVTCWSEQLSSAECSNIAKAVCNTLAPKGGTRLPVATGTVSRMYLMPTVSPRRRDGTWRVDVPLRMFVRG